MGERKNKLFEIFGGRKMFAASLAIGLGVVLCLAGKIAGNECLDFVKWIVSALILGIAWEDGKKVAK